jgi:hypothetical protein
MGCSRSVEPFEPILIEERGERRLPERRLPDDPEQRGRGLILIARRRQQNCRALGRRTVEGVGPGSKPELDDAAPLRWGQRKMSDLVQDHIGFGRTVQCRPVPVEGARDFLRVDRDVEATCEGKRCKTMPLYLGSGGAVR